MNRATYILKPCVMLLVDAAEMQSETHADFGFELLQKARTSEAIGDITSEVSSWPASSAKTDGIEVARGYAAVFAGLTRALGYVKSADYVQCSEQFRAVEMALSRAASSAAAVFASVEVVDWESALRKALLFKDEAGTVHVPECPIVEEGTAKILKASKKNFVAEVTRTIQDEGKQAQLAAWIKRPPGSRGVIPVRLSRAALRELCPTHLLAFVPAPAGQGKRCEICAP